MKIAESKPTIRFSGRFPQPGANGKNGSWTPLALPKIARSEIPSRGGTTVEGTLNGFPFRAAVEPDGKGSHWLRVSNALREAAGADVEDSVTVEITRIGEEPELRVPEDLRTAIEAAPSPRALWAEITPMARRDWVRWIASAKQEETRRRRIEVALDKLSSGMRRPCCFPGINFVTKGHVPPDETWVPLPSSRNRASAKSAR